ncbi:sigma-70 family RNA polymerase sigma factor [Metasolibacillus meyeri]|uniref:sigma-70 family RNA polymerase sigma factor n=1 Tax=Metasolibacillus meyeri TaxID=1071052 RepID=UPI000D3069C5|nr:sigma-70 family RNA polymerase sigma factor [Metasolibacillus meyeri]
MVDNSSLKIKKLLNNNKVLENPLVKSFLEDEEHFTLFENAILNPTQENKNKVEVMFKSYYEKIRINSYFKNLIRYYAIDFDKKIRRINNRYVLSLDRQIGKDDAESETFKELIENEGEMSFESEEITLRDEISNELLFQALEVLTETQYTVLDLIYVKNFTRTEVAKLMNSSPQNISNIHKKAIAKLKNCIRSEDIEKS